MDRRLPVVFLELNELTPAIMDRFIAEGQLPNFKRLRDRSEVFTTDAEEPPPYLEPWIQWVTVHTGVPYSEHGVYRLSEGHKIGQKCIWDLVSQAGEVVWVCGSMNCRYDRGTRGWVLPDPWSTDVAPYPDALLPYLHFVQRNVQEYTSDRVPLGRRDYLKFLGFMAGHGLSAATAASIVQQLIAEKRTRRGGWRRAFILEKLQLDLFSAMYRRLKPSFSTFFLNSTAHMQHCYWRYMEPELFKLPISTDKQREYQNAILEGYRAMDKLIGRILKLVGDDAVIVMATALSQQPCLVYEEQGGKQSYRPKDFADLMTFAGITSAYQVSPVMAEQFWLKMENPSDAIEAETQLGALMVGEQKAMAIRRGGNDLFVACGIKQAVPQNSALQVANSDRSTPFFELFYPLEGGKSGMHHPDGILWVRHPQRAPAAHGEKVGLLTVAPTILDVLGIEKPEYMKGTSLYSRVTPVSPRTREAEVAQRKSA
ncbi:MAG: alkaline phosphatase family protein [Acidobacteriia bacterium]|nr:alkaline phosphatase family protein [Terriglobia bacterium]